MRNVGSLGFMLLVLVGCGSNTKTGDVGNGNNTGDVSGHGGDSNTLTGDQNQLQEQPTPGVPYVATAIRVKTPEGKNIYLGVYSSMPTGTLSTANMREFGDADISYFEGDAFVWDRDGSVLTRFTVDANAVLSQKDQVSLQNLGVSGKQYIAYASSERAFSYGSFDSGSTSVTVFNPNSMEIVGSLDASAALSSVNYDDSVVSKPVYFGKYAAFTLSWENQDNLLLDPRALVVLVDTTSDSAAVTLVQDTRCAGSSALFVDTHGDLYVTNDAAGGEYQIYTNNTAPLPNACVLRIKKDTTVFDSTYQLDLIAATGKRAIKGSWQVSDDTILVQALSSDVTLGSSASDYSSKGRFDAMLVNLQTQATTTVSGLTELNSSNTDEHRLNGQLYFQVYTATGKTTNVNVYAINSDGTSAVQFSLPGDVWSIGSMSSH